MEEKTMLDKTAIEELLRVPVARFFENGENLCPPIAVGDAIIKTVALEPKKSQYNTMHCPCCGVIVNEWHHYCPDCGQRLSWEYTRLDRRDNKWLM